MKLLTNNGAGVAVLHLDAGEFATLDRGNVALERGDVQTVEFSDTIARIDGPAVISLHTYKKDDDANGHG